ncbi:hypothetical protein AB0D04_24300 [Streptomyces sp. NPDC048483]|uniref:hypothetical protein n=1 Tax=Streptomyces sp. NPDC048483 TaxID=3154927 RepID=UPI00342AFE80
MAEVLQRLGMVSQDKAHTVVEEMGTYGYNLTPYDVACSLVGFGVAVEIHADDIDFLEESYAWLLNKAVAVTGGAVTVTNVRLHEGHTTEGFGRPDFDSRDDVLEFERNGQLISIPSTSRRTTTTSEPRSMLSRPSTPTTIPARFTSSTSSVSSTAPMTPSWRLSHPSKREPWRSISA